MPNPRNIRSVHIQACQSADVSFNMPGVIGAQNFDHGARKGAAFIGSRVKTYDFAADLYTHFSESTDDKARLKFDSARIRTHLSGADASPYLFALRNEGLASALDQAIEQRAAAFLDKYRFAAEFAKVIGDDLPGVVTDLTKILEDLDRRFQETTEKLNKENLIGARLVKSVTRSPVMMMASSTLNPENPAGLDPTATVAIKEENGDKTLQRQLTLGYTASVPMRRGQNGLWAVPPKTADDEIVTQSTITESVTHPILDTALTHRQNRVSVLKERIQSRTLLTKLPAMVDAMRAELNAVDLGIRALQVNFAHTYLVPPIDGLITAVYKDIGESVEAAEPVLRIENDAFVLFVGKIQWRGPLWVGRPVRIHLNSMFEMEGKGEVIEARVLSIRGHNSDNDEWDFVAEAKNPATDGRLLLPLNYHLDPDTDWVEF